MSKLLEDFQEKLFNFQIYTLNKDKKIISLTKWKPSMKLIFFDTLM